MDGARVDVVGRREGEGGGGAGERWRGGCWAAGSGDWDWLVHWVDLVCCECCVRVLREWC